MDQDPKEPTPWQSVARVVTTQVTAHAPLGSGVAGNTTFGLWASSLLAAGLGITFVVCGYPEYAIAALVLCGGWNLVHQNRTWTGIAKNPDAGVTGEQAYAQVIQIRQGARNSDLVRNDPPVIGGSATDVPMISGPERR